ncbi:hypothetical protein CANINC_003069 [Pichia inconspicua]|uniref:CRIB domain-containing protein n=1 Tax=Pichia inconspicua TaxID=52247 RepID=A0A4T0X035_9ASCO|nr:hypothetical protein CANINC_003069 [[Candida] inconspicua]
MPRKQETLWLDETERGLKLLHNPRVQRKLLKLLKHFDSSQPREHKPSQNLSHKISSPISFSHVSHIDTRSDFGLQHSFGVDSALVKSMVPETMQSKKRISSSYSNSNITVLTQATNSSSIEDENMVEISPSPYSSTLDPGTKITAVSSYRTSPAPLSLSKSSSLKRIHRRNSSSCSTTFSNRASRISYQSESTTLASPSENDLRKHLLPIIPQEDIEQEDNFENRFVSIPSAPPPPPPPQPAPREASEKISASEQMDENANEVPVIDDSDLESDDDASHLEKFRFSTHIESLINKEIDRKLKDKYLSKDFRISQKCRDSIIELLKSETDEENGIRKMLSGMRMTEIFEESETENDDFDIDQISFIDTTLTLDLEDVELSDIEI